MGLFLSIRRIYLAILIIRFVYRPDETCSLAKIIASSRTIIIRIKLILKIKNNFIAGCYRPYSYFYKRNPIAAHA